MLGMREEELETWGRYRSLSDQEITKLDTALVERYRTDQASLDDVFRHLRCLGVDAFANGRRLSVNKLIEWSCLQPAAPVLNAFALHCLLLSTFWSTAHKTISTVVETERGRRTLKVLLEEELLRLSPRLEESEKVSRLLGPTAPYLALEQRIATIREAFLGWINGRRSEAGGGWD